MNHAPPHFHATYGEEEAVVGSTVWPYYMGVFHSELMGWWPSGLHCTKKSYKKPGIGRSSWSRPERFPPWSDSELRKHGHVLTPGLLRRRGSTGGRWRTVRGQDEAAGRTVEESAGQGSKTGCGHRGQSEESWFWHW